MRLFNDPTQFIAGSGGVPKGKTTSLIMAATLSHRHGQSTFVQCPYGLCRKSTIAS